MRPLLRHYVETMSESTSSELIIFVGFPVVFQVANPVSYQ